MHIRDDQTGMEFSALYRKKDDEWKIGRLQPLNKTVYRYLNPALKDRKYS